MRTIFKKLFDQAKSELPAKKRADKKLEEEGYELVRKVIVTPSRMLLIAPELGMGNRGIRDFTSSDQDVIRVHFREHDGDKLRENRCGKELIEKTVGGVMQNGLKIAGKKYVYFGNSSSQLRDNGCYFFAESIIQEVREKIGSFKDNTSVPKRMSRIGQFFTQAQRLKDNVQREQYRDIHDYLGGCDPSGAPYTFSDGVGMISQKFAEEVAEDLGLEGHVPSCFQIRFRGFKGVLSVNPVLDIIPTKLPLHFCFRESQKKFFFRKKTTGSPFEIVKYSSPCSVSLNKPVLNILDQVSEKQSLTTHRRIMKRVHELLDKQIDALALGLTSEQHCREKLAEMSLKIDVERLDYSAALCRNSIRKIRTKNSIQIPPHFGRTLFGIVDESGQLQYGQIYCQVTENVHVKNPKKSAPKKVIKGRVLMSKNPAIIGGDVRVFEAVDVPELTHLVDVVVFPRYGPRPHPDEMAGSDLDGDEYTLIWDKNLLLDYTMDFPKAKAKVEEIKEDQIVDKFREFFVDYVRNDSVGQLSVAHLAVSDLYGLDCQPSNNLAVKIAKALDFSKTGESPSQIRGEGESPAINPDFLEKRHCPSGRSPGLNGQIYRRAKEIDDILRKCMSASEQEPVELDPDLMTTGWKEYEEDAKKDFANYAGQIRTILDKYGVENEAQLFSGSIIEFRRRVGEICTDKNDMYGSFNVFANIDRLVSGVFYSFRTAFFELFGVHDENGFICQEPSEAMRKLASAYYVVTYRAAKDNEPDRLLSFPWVVWDVLAVVKRKNYVGRRPRAFSPLVLPVRNQDQQPPQRLQPAAAEGAARIQGSPGKMLRPDDKDVQALQRPRRDPSLCARGQRRTRSSSRTRLSNSTSSR
ncbi:hypothetical protein L596_022840 [Steinernema carpocapsae]|uniref:RNA-dependent RNA polymerase n=1 Tax=Steinernema carpocapsae TaxID=34508 RepID=A0A4U5MN09_STECR|nr:hypothetical protein L596_022840 [Steinernema carpocapsae]